MRTRRTSPPAHQRLDPVGDEEHPDLGVAIPSDAIEALLAAHRIVLLNHDPAVSAQQLLGAISALVLRRRLRLTQTQFAECLV